MISVAVNTPISPVEDRTDINDAKRLEINLSPNPAQDYLMVSMDGLGDEKVALSVMDITGKVALQTEGNAVDGTLEQSLDIQTLSEGIYVLEARSKSGIKTVKFVKE